MSATASHASAKRSGGKKEKLTGGMSWPPPGGLSLDDEEDGRSRFRVTAHKFDFRRPIRSMLNPWA
jgi:hypothetical protein